MSLSLPKYEGLLYFLQMIFVVILIARRQEIDEQTDRELRFAGEKKRHGLGYY